MEQFYFVIAVLVIGILNWLVKQIQEKGNARDAEELRREMESLDPERRRELDKINTQPQRQPHHTQPQRQPQKQPQRQPGEAEQHPLRDIMGELLGIPRQERATPPPLPRNEEAPVARRSAPSPKKPQPAARESANPWESAKPAQKKARKLTSSERKAFETVERHQRSDSSRDRRIRSSQTSNMRALRKIIAEPGGLKRAVLLREILGPPQSMKPRDYGP